MFVAYVACCLAGRPWHVAYVSASDRSWTVHPGHSASSTHRVGAGICSRAAGVLVVPEGLSKGTHPDVRPTGTRSAWEGVSGQSIKDCYWFGRLVRKRTL